MKTIFESEMAWQFHTTMTYDLAYEVALYEKCKNIAVYYDGKKKEDEEKNTCSRAVDPELVDSVTKICHPVVCNGQTYHAKISLIKYKDGKYRLIVWSKNHGFTANVCADIGVAFDLDLSCPKNDEEQKLAKRNGDELKSYLKKTYCKCISPEGKTWLENNGLIKDDSGECTRLFDYVTLSYKNRKKDIVLFFGGCSQGSDSLAEKMKLEVGCGSFEPLVILTPPIFVSGSYKKDIEENINKSHTNYEDEFKKFCKKIKLYETKKQDKDDNYPVASHIKLYLFDEYVFVGSANSTKAGIGYDLMHVESYDQPSVECLVGFKIDSNTSKKMKEEIEKNYEIFAGEFQFKHQENKFALYLMDNYEIADSKFKSSDEKEQSCGSKIKKLEFRFQKKRCNDPACKYEGHSVKISPIEYEFALEENELCSAIEDSFDIKVDGFKKFKNLSGYMLVLAKDAKGKEKRYIWYTGIPGMPESLTNEETCEDERIINQIFDCNSYDDIKGLQEKQIKYKDNPKMAAFFEALLKEK